VPAAEFTNSFSAERWQMVTQTRPPEELFTLNVVAPHLKGFQPPRDPHDPQGDWALDYGVYTLGSIRGHGGRLGSLNVKRKATGGEGAILGIEYQKRVNPDFLQKVVAEITCGGDRLATPTRWSCSAEIARRDGGTLEGTRLEKSGEAKDRQIEITDRRGVRRIAAPSSWTVNWALFEAAGRLAREPFEPIRFALLDHFDQLKENQVLSYRQSVEVAIGNKPSRLHAYDHLGEGIVPWIYWVDEAGRLLFAVSGLEAYLLDPFGPS
jgi:hypothetical protein